MDFSIIAMILALSGSRDFVDGRFERGSWKFLFGNAINMAMGLAVGNVWLFIGQASLAFFTLGMPQQRRALGFTLVAATFLLVLTINGTDCMWYGAKC